MSGCVLKSILNGISHITGGGLLDNPARVLADDKMMVLFRDKWTFPVEFQFLQEKGNLSNNEMYHVFNCGIGMLLISDTNTIMKISELLPESFVVGNIQKRDEGEKAVKIIE